MREKRVKSEEEQDKVLRITIAAVVVLLLIGTVVVVMRLMNPLVDVKAGISKLEEMEKVNVSKLDAQITEIETAEKAADEEWQNRSPNEKFANSLILGDSIAQGLYEFGIMDQTHVLATKGAEIADPEKSGSMEHLRQAANAKVQNVFFCYGMNDLEAARGDAEAFVQSYKTYIDEARTLLPDTTIYINSILPVQQTAVAQKEEYQSVSAFNERLKQLCEEEGIIFIDQTTSVKEEYYEPDGIHLKPDFYLGWVNRMAEEAEI